MMMKLDDTGKYVEAPYDLELMSFEFEGSCIQNPYVSECSRFKQDPAYYGFEVTDTGGGRTALTRLHPAGGVLMITAGSGTSVPANADDSDNAILCRFDADGSQIAWCYIRDIPDL